MLIDFHTHCFPEKIAERAVQQLSFVSGGLEYHTDGTEEGLRRSMKKGGVDISVVLSIATNAQQQKNVNEYAAKINNGIDIFAFGSVYPGSEDVLEQLEIIKDMGLKGIKLHPEYQKFCVDDPKMKPIYKKISSLWLITVFHAGIDYGFAPPYGATPDKIARALSWFDSPVVAAHWGGLGCNKEVLELLCGRDIYFDISFGYSSMPKYYAEKIVEKHGVDRLLFGTDTPWHTADMELRLLSSLKLCAEDEEKIRCGNAKKLLLIK